MLRRKNNNIIEQIFVETTNEYIFEDSKISEKLIQHRIKKISKRSYNASFEKNIEKNLSDTLKKIQQQILKMYFL